MFERIFRCSGGLAAAFGKDVGAGAGDRSHAQGALRRARLLLG